jgi:Mycothiol maleylpyruvate isomerase N-terminal domain
MAADRSYVETNRRELERLTALVDRASDDDLARPMADGWTVASVLGHVAFWDLRIVTALERWGPDGTGPFPSYYDDAVDWINDAAKPLISALEPRAAARVAIEAAEAADRGVAEMSDELLEKNEATGGYINTDRADHRGEHLDEIEKLLPPA